MNRNYVADMRSAVRGFGRALGRDLRRGLGVGGGRGARSVFAAERGQRGVSMVELMVAMFIFMIVSGIFLTSIIQFLHTTTMDAVRTRSASQIATVTQRIDRYVRYASAMEYDNANQKVTMLMPGDAAGKQRCVVLEYSEATWVNGSVDTYGKLVLKTKDAGASAWSSNVVLGSLMNHSSSSGVTSDDALFGTQLLGLDGTKKVLTFSPVAGSYAGGKPVTSNVSTTFTARNVKSTNPTPDFSVCN